MGEIRLAVIDVVILGLTKNQIGEQRDVHGTQFRRFVLAVHQVVERSNYRALIPWCFILVYRAFFPISATALFAVSISDLVRDVRHSYPTRPLPHQRVSRPC